MVLFKPFSSILSFCSSEINTQRVFSDLPKAIWLIFPGHNELAANIFQAVVP